MTVVAVVPTFEGRDVLVFGSLLGGEEVVGTKGSGSTVSVVITVVQEAVGLP